MVGPSLHLVLILLLSTLMVSCSEDDASAGEDLNELFSEEKDTALISMLKETYGIRITGFQDALSSAIIEDDGAVTFNGPGRIDVDGLGGKDIFIEETVSQASDGGDVLLFVQESDSGEERYFLYNVEENFVTIGQDKTNDDVRGVTVSKNNDSTYTVWSFDENTGGVDEETRMTVPNGYAALQQVLTYNDFNTISPHIMLAAFAIAHTPLPEGRSPAVCDDTAAGPAVCTLFKEFCDCAACYALSRTGGQCAQCPEL